MSLTPIVDLTKVTIRRSPGMVTQKMRHLTCVNIAFIATLMCVRLAAVILDGETLNTIANIMTLAYVPLTTVTFLHLAANITNRANIKDNLRWLSEEMGVLFEEQQFMDLTDVLTTTSITPDTPIQSLAAKDTESGRLAFEHISTELRRLSDVSITWETAAVSMPGGGEVRYSLKVEGECNTPFTSYTAYLMVRSSRFL